MLADVGIVVAGISGDLLAQECGAEKLFVHVGEFDLGKHESFVVAMKLIHLDGVLPVVHEVACLLYAHAGTGGKPLPVSLESRNRRADNATDVMDGD